MEERWLQTLANYQFTIQHRPGKKHANADALSRVTHLAGPDGSTSMDLDQAMLAPILAIANSEASSALGLRRSAVPLDDSALRVFPAKPTPAQLLRAQSADVDIRGALPLVVDRVTSAPKALYSAASSRGKSLLSSLPHLCLREGLLFHRDPNSPGLRERFVLPADME